VAQRAGIAEGGIFKVRPPDSKIDEDDNRTVVDCGYVCPAFSNTFVGSSYFMTIELSYRYSKLDKTHCFGLVFNATENYETYIRWVWYYLGQQLVKKPRNVRIYPFNYNGKVLKNYKFCNDAQRQAVLLSNAIKRRLP